MTTNDVLTMKILVQNARKLIDTTDEVPRKMTPPHTLHKDSVEPPHEEPTHFFNISQFIYWITGTPGNFV